ncbi:hypothetical protein NKDENANG_01478 [Candidatus Entotheonellaceae bacterium PAL068K]
MALGDVDGDGDLDVVTANAASDDVSLLLGNGDGTLQAAQTFAVGSRSYPSVMRQPFSVALGDVNSDGDLDVITPHSVTDEVSLLLGNGDGTLQAAQTFGAGYGVGDAPFSVALGDVNSDGDLDVVTANTDSDDVSLLLGNGDGTF